MVAAEPLSDSGEQNILEQMWDKENRCYREGSGVFDVNGVSYKFEVKLHRPYAEEDASGDKFATRDRAITQIGVDLESPPDIVLPILPGWGETSAMFEGDFLKTLLRVLQMKGYTNPRIIGINACGKGSSGYQENKDQISKVGMIDEFDDVEAVTEYLFEQGAFGDEKTVLSPIGHSMGVLNVIVALDKLIQAEQSKEGVADVREEVRRRIEAIVLMPATDQPGRYLRSGKFLGRVATASPQALWQTKNREGCIDQDEFTYSRRMLGRKVRDYGLWRRAVQDSGRRFVNLTFNGGRKLDDRFSHLSNAGVKFHIARGGKDRLLPRNMAKDWRQHLLENNIEVPPVEVLHEFYHAINFRMNDAQKREMSRFLHESIPTKIGTIGRRERKLYEYEKTKWLPVSKPDLDRFMGNFTDYLDRTGYKGRAYGPWTMGYCLNDSPPRREPIWVENWKMLDPGENEIAISGVTIKVREWADDVLRRDNLRVALHLLETLPPGVMKGEGDSRDFSLGVDHRSWIQRTFGRKGKSEV